MEREPATQAATIPEQPPEDGAVAVSTEILQEQHSELDSQEQTPVEQGAQLLKIAAKAARADAIDRGAYANANVYNAVGITSAVIANAGSSLLMDTYPMAVNGMVVLTGLTAYGEWFRSRVLRDAGRTSLALPDGYSLQCLRVAQHTASIPDGRVAVAIHPRHYSDEPEHPALAKQRLAQALDVIAAAEAGDASHIRSIIVPASVVQRAGLHYAGNRTYNKVVRDIAVQEPRLPYTDEERAVIIPASRAAELSEYLRGDHEPLLKRVLAEVATKYPAKREALTPDNLMITTVLHGLLERAAAAGEGFRTKRRDTTPVVFKKEVDGEEKITVVDAWRGGWITDTEDVAITVNRTNAYNPRLEQRSAKTAQQIGSSDLRTMTGGDETMQEIAMKLNEGRYDNLQLLRVALELLERREITKEEQAVEDLNKLPRGAAAKLIEAAVQQPNTAALRARFLGRVVLTTGTLAATGTLASGLLDMVKPNPPVTPPPPAISITPEAYAGETLYRVEDHGLELASPYWSQHIDYYRSPRYGWTTGTGASLKEVFLPTTLENTEVPHLTVATHTADKMFSLPIQEGAGIAAIRALDVNNKALPVSIFRREDGEVLVEVKEPNGGFYRLEYDLVADTTGQWAIDPAEPISVIPKGTIVEPEKYPGAKGGAAAMASFIANQFIYDNGSWLKKEYAQYYDDPNGYVQHAYEVGRCQCSQCNTTVALLHAELYPDVELGYVTGYLGQTDEQNGHAYLTGSRYHAWLNDGKTIDATAGRTDARSETPKHRPVEDIEKEWSEQAKSLHLEPPKQPEQQPKPLPREVVWSLVGLFAAGLAGVELRHRILRRAAEGYLQWDRRMSASLDLDPRDAVRILGWEAFAAVGNRMPETYRGASYNGQREENIPTETLQRVARGEVRTGSRLTPAQTRGLRLAARAILQDRRRQDQALRRSRSGRK